MPITPTLLIADDDAAVRAALEALFAPEPYRLVFAEDGAEALALAAEIFPDVVLLDVMMPRLDGLEVCRRLRADPRLGAVPILLVTALEDPASRLAGIEAGADDFLSKPFDHVELLARVRAFLKFNRYRQLYEERVQLEAERQHAEAALRRLNTYHRSLIEAALDPLVTIGPDGKITDVNAATEAITGYARDQLIGTDFCDYFTDPVKARAGYQQVFRDGQVRDYALEIRHRSGKVTPVLYNASLYRDEAGQTAGVFAAARDLTEHQRAEALRREMEVQMQVLHQLDRLRAELIGNVSHELRTPLGLILVMATALQEEHFYANPEVRDQLLRDIEEEARNLQGIVDALLDESHLQSGRLALDRRKVDVGALICRTVELQAPRAPQHRVICQLPEAALLATVDAQRIEQVLRNLLDNAIKYSPAGATITVSATAEAEGRPLRVAVSDEGPGIPPAERERIFERFYRIVDSNAPPVAGLGLGLSICRGIVEGHGGHLWVEERPGGGSVFVFALPRGNA